RQDPCWNASAKASPRRDAGGNRQPARYRHRLGLPGSTRAQPTTAEMRHSGASDFFALMSKSRCRARHSGNREPDIMKAILLAGTAAVLMATSAAWPRHSALPGDQFQLAASEPVMVQKPAQDHGAPVQTQLAIGKSIIGPVAKGEGWM